MVTILYRVKHNADSDKLIACDAVGVVTDPDCYIMFTVRVFNEFTAFVNTHSEVEAIEIAVKLMESWVR